MPGGLTPNTTSSPTTYPEPELLTLIRPIDLKLFGERSAPSGPYGAPNASSPGVVGVAPDVNRTLTFVIGPTDSVWKPKTSTIRVFRFGLVTVVELAN